MKMKYETVQCGFKKWSVSVGENQEVIISFDHFPNVGTISLHDGSLDDFRQLADLFNQVYLDCKNKFAIISG